MSDLLERAISTVRSLPPDEQDEIARMLLQWTGDGEPAVTLTPQEEASFAESLAQAEARQYATDEQVRAVWAKHRL